jgi:hypothetical protein
MSKTIRLTLIERESSRDINFTVRRPAMYQISPYLITSDEEVEVVGEKTSGEVESVLLLGSEEKYLTVGSDQTDREIERLGYAKSKQICRKVIAEQVWPYNEVKDHYDELILRSEVEKDGQKHLYQEGSVSGIMKPLDLAHLYDIEGDGTALFSGTIPTKMERLIFGDWYRLELIDPVLDRRIVHSYSVKMI